MVTWVFLFGWLFTTPIGWNQAAAIDWSAFDARAWAGVAYVVLATTFLVYLLNIFALQHLQPTVVSVYIYLQPLLATLLSMAQAHFGGTDYMVDTGWPSPPSARSSSSGCISWEARQGNSVGGLI